MKLIDKDANYLLYTHKTFCSIQICDSKRTQKTQVNLCLAFLPVVCKLSPTVLGESRSRNSKNTLAVERSSGHIITMVTHWLDFTEHCVYILLWEFGVIVLPLYCLHIICIILKFLSLHTVYVVYLYTSRVRQKPEAKNCWTMVGI